MAIILLSALAVCADPPEPSLPTAPCSYHPQVGDKALRFDALNAAAEAMVTEAESITNKVVLLTFLSLEDKDFSRRMKIIERINRTYSDRRDFQIVVIFMDEWEDYYDYITPRGNSFYSNSRMWILCHNYLSPQVSKENNSFGEEEVGEGMTPRSFLIDVDQKYLAVDIPLEDLEIVTKSHLIDD